MRALSVAVSALALFLALGDVAFASECHRSCDGGYLAMTALVAGSLALGSAALGTRIGGSGALKRVDRADADVAPDAKTASMSRIDEAVPPADLPPVPPEDRGTTAVTAAGTDSVTPGAATPAAAEAPPLRDAHDRAAARGTAYEPGPAAAEVDHGAKVAKQATDYAGKLAKEMAPRGEAIDSSLGIAQKVIANEDRVAGLAEGLTDTATDELKDIVKDATKVTTPAPGVGTTVRYCRSCGTKTREGARYCASCGQRLG